MKSSLIVWLALFALAAARPKTKSSVAESDGETKLREKRKYEIPLLQQLEESGVGVKEAEETKESPSEVVESPPEGEKGGKGGAEEETASGGGPRVKKQSPNNVCIKIGGCGKTVCGPIVSARGAVVGDMKALLQSGKPMLPLGEMRAPSEMTELSSKLEALAPLRARTVDSIGAPLGLGTLGYGAPASYPTLDLGHSFFKPPSMPSVAVITPQQPSHPLIHPWLAPHILPHILPHLMPALMPALGSYFPHRLEPSRFPEVIPTEVKQPVPVFPQPFYGVNGDNALLCQPVRNRGLDGSYDSYYKPDAAADKSINVTEESKKSQNGFGGDDERNIHDHIKKVNEIKDEITQLNRAAQRIVDQQERLAAMQHRQTWPTPRQSQGFDQPMNPYMGTDFYAHPAFPWGYSRSSLMSYPRSEDDIDFFINLLRMGKKMGTLSDAVHPTSVLSTIGELLKGVQNGDKVEKEPSVSGAQTEETAAAKPEKKSIK